jgi:hypothetical protein
MGENPLPDETTQIDTGDVEIKKYFDMMDKDAVIWIFSCSGAAPAPQGRENLATFLTHMAGGREVIAGRETYSITDVVVNQVYPFSINIFNKGKNITYKATLLPF